MSAKLFQIRRDDTAVAAWALLCAAALASGVSCRERHAKLTAPGVAVDTALQANHFAEAFRKLGRSHLRGVAHFQAGPDGGTTEDVNTETDIWMDDTGNWRLVDLNNKDGGREVVLHGRQLAIALRYGKMIKRAAEDPEPMRLLAEGVGAPFAAWDLLRDVVQVDDFGIETRAGRQVHSFKLSKASKPPAPAKTIDAADRRGWRRTLVVETVDGTIAVDEKTGVPLLAEVKASYTMRRGGGGSGADGVPMHGALAVRTSIEEIGQSPAIAEPEAEALAPRQRTVPDERALLGGLPRAPARPRGTP
ncbi:MAG TPA: hypothetical protein VHU40_17755 [Polyangia bacterium]|nr:hypothetical protein [Polyangia bacterium]